MKKEDVVGSFVYILILGLAAVFVFAVLAPRANASGLADLYFLFNLGGLVAGGLFNALLFEIAHVIGAKIGGYKVTYVSVFGLTLKKESNKWKFCFSDFSGLTGETRIAPNKEDIHKCNPYPFLLGGTFSFVAELIFVLVFFFVFKDNEDTAISNLAYFFLDMLAIGSMFFMYNIIPAKLDCTNDGYNLFLFANPKNREAFNELLKVNYELSLGNNVEIKLFDEITNFTADLNMNKAYFLANENKVSEGLEILDKIVQERKNLSYEVYLKAQSEKIYIKFVNDTLEDAVKYYEEIPVSERRDIANKNSMSCLRAYLLMSGLADKSRSECVVCLNKIAKALKKVPEKMKSIEIKMINFSIKKINYLHEKWELTKYLFEDKNN